MKFTKMHGIGNDYIYVNGFTEKLADPAKTARKIADRHLGVGGDGLILILPSKKADVRMRMFNADGSEAEMCGNGIRCVAKFAYEHGLAKKNPMTVETIPDVKSLSLHVDSGKVDQVTVNMGQPVVRVSEVPVDRDFVSLIREPLQYSFVIERAPTEFETTHYGAKQSLRETIEDATFVSMGNPHGVIYVDNVHKVNLPYLGPLVEHFKAFPNRINAHWVEINSPTEVTMRTWERGSGITRACGTGACAVCVAGVVTERTNRKILAHLPGGDLKLEWRESDNCVYMTGSATEVFSGEWTE